MLDADLLDTDLVRMTSLTGTTVPVMIEYLDLDQDGVPDAVRIRRAVPGEVADRVEQGYVLEELATAIGIDDVPRVARVMALR